MKRDELADLSAFAIVAEERSFTRAAVRLGVSASALSHLIRALESRLGVRLLTRTTRSVAPTEAGATLLETLVPAFGAVGAALDQLNLARDVPAGNVRITAVRHAVRRILDPALAAFLAQHQDITIEIAADDHLKDIVACGYDAGIRLGQQVDEDMVSVRISGEIPTAVVAAPEYFKTYPIPQCPDDLAAHECIGHRMGTGALHPWPFQDSGRAFSVKVKGRLTFNEGDLILDAALSGCGLAYLFADDVETDVQQGQLVKVLDRWTTIHTGYYLYYASRRQQPPALAALVEWLRQETVAARQ